LIQTFTPTSTGVPSSTATEAPTPTLTLTPPPTPTATSTPDTLRFLADRAGISVGAAFVEGSHEEEFRAVLVGEFNSVTAPLYWTSTEGERGSFNFVIPDLVLDLAEKNGLRVRGHPLVWGRLARPEYVQNATSAEQLRAFLREHIEAVVGRYKGRIDQYDVVNEPITILGADGVGGDGLENYIFLELLGPNYVREALDLAHAADPEAKLFINDFFVMEPGAKQDHFYDLARSLVESGAPLHGVGFQGHITPPFYPQYAPTREHIEAAIERFADLGLEVEITEIDVTLTDPASQLEAQRETYHDLFAACLSVARCRGLTTWGITDAFSWIFEFFGVDGAPLMFDKSYQRKPAYFGAREAIQERLDQTR
jgi:endo-1,4-beta-xylanase